MNKNAKFSLAVALCFSALALGSTASANLETDSNAEVDCPEGYVWFASSGCTRIMTTVGNAGYAAGGGTPEGTDWLFDLARDALSSIGIPPLARAGYMSSYDASLDMTMHFVAFETLDQGAVAVQLNEFHAASLI